MTNIDLEDIAKREPLNPLAHGAPAAVGAQGPISLGDVRRISTSSLIEIFYSLAIAAGMQDAIHGMFEPRAEAIALRVVGLVGALALALGDWATYNVFVAHLPYRTIVRVLGDMTIVVAIFLTFEASGSPRVYAAAVLAYFILGSAYYLLMRREGHGSKDSSRMALVQLTFGLVLAGFATAAYLGSLSDQKLFFVAVLVAAAWSGLNLREAGRHLWQTSTTPPG